MTAARSTPNARATRSAHRGVVSDLPNGRNGSIAATTPLVAGMGGKRTLWPPICELRFAQSGSIRRARLHPPAPQPFCPSRSREFEARTQSRVTRPKGGDSTRTPCAFQRRRRGLMHWHHGANTPPSPNPQISTWPTRVRLGCILQRLSSEPEPFDYP